MLRSRFECLFSTALLRDVLLVRQLERGAEAGAGAGGGSQLDIFPREQLFGGLPHGRGQGRGRGRGRDDGGVDGSDESGAAENGGPGGRGRVSAAATVSGEGECWERGWVWRWQGSAGAGAGAGAGSCGGVEEDIELSQTLKVFRLVTHLHRPSPMTCRRVLAVRSYKNYLTSIS